MNHPAATIAGNMEIDPLSSYEYPAFDNYPHPVSPTQPYPYSVKMEETIYNTYQPHKTNYINNIPHEQFKTPLPTLQNVPEIPQQPVQEEVKTDIGTKRKKKDKNSQKSTYCSQKITDAMFPFYGCSVCNISYTALQELDQHVTVHKNRMTSYRLRLRNQFKKKQMKKEKKKLKKMIKIKKENFDVEIKPEDGYIGNEKASEFEKNVVNSECNQNSAVETSENNINSNNDLSSVSVNNKIENNNVNSENNVNNKDGSMDEAELNNLEKIYKCFACQKQFTLSYYLKLHVRSHTDEKPYTCSVCGQSFITSSKLGRHNKRIHLAERYQCRICFKIFSRFELLTAHFDKTHPEDKLEGEPYDYNAILPYLKELEEQLREQSEQKSEKYESEEKPPPSELLWEEQVRPHMVTVADAPEVKAEVPDEDQKDLVPKIDVVVDMPKYELDVKVKMECPDDDDFITGGDDYITGGDDHITGGDDHITGGDDHIMDGDQQANDDPKQDVKDEDSASDEDYFPVNTWAATPKPELPPSSPKRRTKTSKVCEICNKKVSSASYMRIHMRTHTGEKPFKCYQCGRGFITSSKMHRHVLTHEAKESSQKEEDGAKSDDQPTDGADENADDSKKSSKKKSKTKSKKSSKLKSAETKPRKKHQKRPHACEYCNQKFLHLNMLEVHRLGHAGEPPPSRCQYCTLDIPNPTELSEHEATHTGPRPYLCTICGNTYKKRDTMLCHRKRHSSDKEFVCEVCSKRFSAACKLNKHMATHGERYVTRYECPVCAHVFRTRYHALVHLNTHQREGLILEENRSEILAMVLQNVRKIPKQADAPANLTDVVPSDERSRICNICGEIFHHFFYLEEHLKSHGSRITISDIEKPEEKKYICPICNKGFKLHYYLKLHSFTHSKEKPFICQQCGKGFITRGKLKRHLETHTGLKKYQCHICYKFFTRPSYLRIHIRTIHGTQDYNFRFDKGYGLNSLAMSAISMSDGSQNSV